MLFFQRRASLNLRGWSRPDNDTSIDFPNVDQLIGSIVAAKFATLHELKSVYTLEDAYDLFEIIAVTRYNEWRAVDAANKRTRK